MPLRCAFCSFVNGFLLENRKQLLLRAPGSTCAVRHCGNGFNKGRQNAWLPLRQRCNCVGGIGRAVTRPQRHFERVWWRSQDRPGMFITRPSSSWAERFSHSSFGKTSLCFALALFEIATKSRHFCGSRWVHGRQADCLFVMATSP